MHVRTGKGIKMKLFIGLVVALLSVALGRVTAIDLFEAVRQNSPELIKKAIESGQNINSIQKGSGQTPVMHACLGGYEKSVEVLIELGADLRMGEKDGYLPMDGAAFQGRPEVLKVLLKHGLDMVQLHSDGYSPFHRALWGGSKGHTEVVRLMLEAGASPFQPSLKGEQPLDIVRNPKTKALLQKWIHNNGLESPPKDAYTPPKEEL